MGGPASPYFMSGSAGLSIDRSSRGTQFFDLDAAAELDEAYRPAGRGGIDVRHSPEIEVPFRTGMRTKGGISPAGRFASAAELHDV